MIVTFGDAIVDLFSLPTGADAATAERFVPRLGGAPCNVAVVAARLGAPARFVGAVGRDGHGARLIEGLRSAGVDTRCVVVRPERTAITFVKISSDGSRSFLFYRQAGADVSLDRDALAAMVPHPLEGARWLVVNSNVVVVEPIRSAAMWLIAEAAARGVRLVVDFNVRAHLWADRGELVAQTRALAARADIVKASEEDLGALGCAATLDALCAMSPAACCVLTFAERGAAVRARADVHVTAPKIHVVDATGAGDAFLAALLVGMEAVGAGQDASDEVWRELLSVACELGAQAVTAVGATDGVVDVGVSRARIDAMRRRAEGG